MGPASITPRPATLVKEANAPLAYLFLVETGINVEFAVLYIG